MKKYFQILVLFFCVYLFVVQSYQTIQKFCKIEFSINMDDDAQDLNDFEDSEEDADNIKKEEKLFSSIYDLNFTPSSLETLHNRYLEYTCFLPETISEIQVPPPKF